MSVAAHAPSASVIAPLAAASIDVRPPRVSLAEAMERSRLDRQARGYVQEALDWRDDTPGGGSVTPLSGRLPDPGHVAGRLGLALAEVLAGLRSPGQLIPFTTPEVYAVIDRRAITLARRAATGPRRQPTRVRLRRVHLCRPASGVAEASVIIEEGGRVRALALRLVGHDGRWRVSAFQIG